MEGVFTKESTPGKMRVPRVGPAGEVSHFHFPLTAEVIIYVEYKLANNKFVFHCMNVARSPLIKFSSAMAAPDVTNNTMINTDHSLVPKLLCIRTARDTGFDTPTMNSDRVPGPTFFRKKTLGALPLPV